MEADALNTVLVAGASGATGQQLLRLAAPRVPTVRALTRDPGKREQLLIAGADEVVVDDLLHPQQLEGALTDVDVVMSAVGSSLNDIRSSGPLVDGRGAQMLLEAAVDADVDAFVMESAIGVGDDSASWLAGIFNLVIAPIQRAKAETEAALRGADIEYTIFRPGILTDGSRTDDVTVAEPGAKLWGSVSRADVARVMLAAPTTPAASNRTFEVIHTPSLSDRGLRIDWQLPGD